MYISSILCFSKTLLTVIMELSAVTALIEAWPINCFMLKHSVIYFIFNGSTPKAFRYILTIFFSSITFFFKEIMYLHSSTHISGPLKHNINIIMKTIFYIESSICSYWSSEYTVLIELYTYFGGNFYVKSPINSRKEKLYACHRD
jgi:hypothetical protein